MKKITMFASALALMSLCFAPSLHAQFSGGTGTASDPFLIKTADDLDNVRFYCGSNNTDKHFRMMNDIDLTDFLQNSTKGWQPIGDNSNFTGYFHGGGYRINGLWINISTTNIGFFGINSGTIDSLIVTITASNINGGYYTGGFVGYNSGPITGCGVEGRGSTGGTAVGGFAGYNLSEISYCYSTSYSSSSSYSGFSGFSGGFVGVNSGTINNCSATGNSSSDDYSGGFVGYNLWGVINNCSATGSSSSFYSRSGGFVAENLDGTINKCYATGNSSGNLSGGFVGNNSGTVTNCYAMGNSSGNSYSGGFIGIVSNGISNCYSVGQVDGDGVDGAFAGQCTDATLLSQCYYNSDINGVMKAVGYGVGGVSGVTTDAMKSKATFINWDFDTVWTIDEGVTYPYFQTSTPTGIRQISPNVLQIYPNPTNGIVYLNCELNTPIRVYSVSGSLLFQSISRTEKETIDLSAYPQGIYLIKTGNRYGKIIKK